MAKANNTTTTTPEDTATVEGVRVEQVDPTTLLIDVNVRTETVADKDFIASVKDLGILQPIRAVRTPEGALRVETGHRRTLAAIEAGLATVPVLVVADEPSDDAGAVERIVRQYAENEHRTGLSTTDRLGVVEQLSLLNVSAAQIAKRTRMTRPQVDQALTVSRSDLAKAASVRYELTIDQAAGVAEFENDPDTVKALVAAAKTGQFDHVLERARQERDDSAQRAQAEADLAARPGCG
jgi:ParB/RepB/Spo0J family partition protein